MGLSKESDVVTVTWREMNGDGEFVCPKCKQLVNPDLPDEWEMIETVGNSIDNTLLIKHLCGQMIKIDVSGMFRGRSQEEGTC